MTRRMTEADWLAVARVFHAIHQRRAAAEAQQQAEDESRRVDGDGDHDAA